MSCELIGVAQLGKDWGFEWECQVHVDSAAAIGTSNRKGNGKLRHVKVGVLWIQERLEDKDISMKKVWGKHNPADAMTKYLDKATLDTHMEHMNFEYREGRAETSLVS